VSWHIGADVMHVRLGMSVLVHVLPFLMHVCIVIADVMHVINNVMSVLMHMLL
jgi:hypothetical protein